MSADVPADDPPPADPDSDAAHADAAHAALGETVEVEERSPRWWWGPAAAGVLAAVLLAPGLLDLAGRMWSRKERDFFPLVLIGAAVLLYFKLRPRPGALDAVPARRPRGWAAALGWAGALLACAAAVVASGHWFSGLAALCVLPAWTYAVGGFPLVRHLAGVWLFLLLALPLPFGWDGALVRALQDVASTSASAVLDLLGYVHVRRGNVLEVAGAAAFGVNEACSGVNSLFSSLCCVGFYLVWADRGLLRSAVVLAATVAWVLVANAARVLAIVLGTVELGGADWAVGGLDLSLEADGWGHAALGYVAFAAALGLVVSTDRLLAFALPPVGSSADLDSIAAGPLRARLRPAPGWVWGGATAGLLAVGAVALIAPAPETDRTVVAGDLGGLRPATEEALPAEWNGWRRVRFVQRRNGANAELLGEFSRIWVYAKGARVASISVDGPYVEWHDLALCYRGQGYDCSEITDIRYDVDPDEFAAEHADETDDADADTEDDAAPGKPKFGDDPEPTGPGDRLAGLDAAVGDDPADAGGGGFTEMTLEDDAGNHGVVLFAAYDDAGRGVDPSAQRFDLDRRLGRLRAVWAALTGGDAGEVAADAGPGRTFQIQLLHRALIEPDEETKEDLRRLFHAMRRRLVNSGVAGTASADEAAAGTDTASETADDSAGGVR